MNLPPPPFHYVDVQAVFFVEHASGRAQLWGHFPVAPTGPFHESWTLEKVGRRWKPGRILVNNLVRCEAGAKFWHMPKVLGPVSFEMVGSENRLTHEGDTSRIFLLGSNPKPVVGARFTLGLTLPLGIVAELTFDTSSEWQKAVLRDHRGSVEGRAKVLTGKSTLTEPLPVRKRVAVPVG